MDFQLCRWIDWLTEIHKRYLTLRAVISHGQYWFHVKITFSFLSNITYLISIYSDLWFSSSHLSCYVCANFIHKCWNVQYTIDSVQQIFEKLFTAMLLTLKVNSQRTTALNWPKEIFFFILSFVRNVWPWLWTVASTFFIIFSHYFVSTKLTFDGFLLASSHTLSAISESTQTIILNFLS